MLSPSFCPTATHDGGGHTAGHNGTTCFTVLEWRIADKPVRKYPPGVAGSILHWKCQTSLPSMSPGKKGGGREGGKERRRREGGKREEKDKEEEEGGRKERGERQGGGGERREKRAEGTHYGDCLCDSTNLQCG